MRISDWSSDVCSSDLLRQLSLLTPCKGSSSKSAPAETLAASRAERALPLSSVAAANAASLRLVSAVAHSAVIVSTQVTRLDISAAALVPAERIPRSEEHTSELQ